MKRKRKSEQYEVIEQYLAFEGMENTYGGITLEELLKRYAQQKEKCSRCKNKYELEKMRVHHDPACPNHDPKSICQACIQSLLCKFCKYFVDQPNDPAALGSVEEIPNGTK